MQSIVNGLCLGKVRSRLIANMVHAKGVLITSYTGATQHKEEMLARNWHYVILDEGHKIRNPDAQVSFYSSFIKIILFTQLDIRMLF